MMRARLSEDKFQIATREYFDLALKPLGAVYFHPANEGKRTGLQGERLKKKGMLPGVPDWIVCYQGRTLFIELKTVTRASAWTEDQRAFCAAVEATGFQYALCRTFAEIELALGNFGVPLRARAA